MADDLLQGVRDGLDNMDAADSAGGLPSMPGMGDFQMPSLEKMLEIIDTLDMSDEEKADLKASLSDKSGMLGNMAQGMGAQAAAYNPWTAYMFFIGAVLVIILILGKVFVRGIKYF